jgi:hypothetical protein
MVDSGYVGSEQLAWSGRDWRMPVWLWVGLATMFVSALHIIIDFGVGLFDLHGTLTLTEAATLVGVALIQVWWAISFMAGARDQRLPDRLLPARVRRGAAADRPRPRWQHRVRHPARVGRHLVAVARPGAPGLVHAGRCGSLGGRDCRVAGEHPDHIGAPTAADIPGSWLSSGGFGVVVPGGVFVVGGCGFEAAVQDADEAVGELAQRGLVADVAVAQLLVVRLGSG